MGLTKGKAPKKVSLPPSPKVSPRPPAPKPSLPPAPKVSPRPPAPKPSLVPIPAIKTPSDAEMRSSMGRPAPEPYTPIYIGPDKFIQTMLSYYPETIGDAGVIPSMGPITQPPTEIPSPGEGKVTWSTFAFSKDDPDYPEGAPSWWKPMKPSEATGSSAYFAMLNMLIPFMSPDAQRSAAATLFGADPEAFAHLNPDKIEQQLAAPPREFKTQVAKYTGLERAQDVANVLTRLSAATGKELGQGYGYLMGLGKLLETTSRDVMPWGRPRTEWPTGERTREQQTRLLEGLESLAAPSESYQQLAQMVALPTGGKMFPLRRQGSRWVYGEANPRLFF